MVVSNAPKENIQSILDFNESTQTKIRLPKSTNIAGGDKQRSVLDKSPMTIFGCQIIMTSVHRQAACH